MFYNFYFHVFCLFLGSVLSTYGFILKFQIMLLLFWPYIMDSSSNNILLKNGRRHRRRAVLTTLVKSDKRRLKVSNWQMIFQWVTQWSDFHNDNLNCHFTKDLVWFVLNVQMLILVSTRFLIHFWSKDTKMYLKRFLNDK